MDGDDEIDMTTRSSGSGGGGGKPNDLLPEATYDAWVTEAVKGKSKTNNPKLTLQHEVFDSNGKNCGFIESVTPLHVDFRVDNLIECLGRPNDGKIKAEAFIGRACQVVVYHDKFVTDRGRTIWSAKVKTFLPRRFKDAGEEDGEPAAPAGAGTAAAQGGGSGGPACPF